MASRQTHEGGSADVTRARAAGSRAMLVKPGRLPVTEFAFDRAGAASPFGDDLRFPLDLSRLTYVHPTAEAKPSPH